MKVTTAPDWTPFTAGRRSAAAALWARWWQGRPPHPGLLLAAGLTSVLAAVPVLYLLVRAARGGAATWLPLLSRLVPGLLWNSITLAAATTAVAVAISVPMAWLVVRTDLPGRAVIRWLAALPLVFPPYVGAFAYITLLGPRGALEQWLAARTGVPGPLLYKSLPQIYSFGGVSLVLALFEYPYVYLLVGSALRNFNQSLEDAARSAGLPPLAVFWRVTLPLLKPAIGAGALMVALYAIADFGAVAMLRYDTFTSAIYLQLRGRLDRSAAAALSTVLIALSALLLWAEGRMETQGRYTQTAGTWRPGRPVALGLWKVPALAFVIVVLLAAVAMPAGMLAYWTYAGLADGAFGHLRLWGYAANSLASSAGAATLGAVAAFPLAYLAARHRGILSAAAFRLGYFGYGLPGVVVALAAIFVFNTFLPPLYGTIWALMAAYMIRYMPQSLGAQHAALLQLSPHLEEAGRSLGYNGLRVLAHITLPLTLPGLLAGWSLVFLNGLKELPATLLLRPAGFDTLAVRVWIDASEGYFAAAAPAALALVLLAALPLAVLLRWVLGGRVRLS